MAQCGAAVLYVVVERAIDVSDPAACERDEREPMVVVLLPGRLETERHVQKVPAGKARRHR